MPGRVNIDFLLGFSILNKLLPKSDINETNLLSTKCQIDKSIDI